MNVERNIWLCEDCTMVAVNGDYTGLDYAYEPEEAAQQATRIDRGLDTLGERGNLVPDWCDENEYECLNCGHFYPEDARILNEDDEDLCPLCRSDSVREREHGEVYFSREECECCGSDLAGHRFRFALLIPTKWEVVENLGYERECVVFTADNYDDADTAYRELYTDAEREELHVAITKDGSTEW